MISGSHINLAQTATHTVSRLAKRPAQNLKVAIWYSTRLEEYSVKASVSHCVVTNWTVVAQEFIVAGT